MAFSHALGIFVLLVRHDDFDVGVPGFVGIAVGEKIDAAVARFFDDANIFRRFALNTDSAELDMGVIDGNVGLLGDFDFFKQRVEGFVGFIANVRAVDAAVFGGAASHGDEFGGVAVAADFVFETTGKADGAFVHGLPGELRHFVDFLREWPRV